MNSTPDILEVLAQRVEAASTLDELRTLIAFEEEVERHHEEFVDNVEGALAQPIDVHRLPAFGGEPPKNMEGVRSWDKDRLLIGSGSSWHLEIIGREEQT